MIQTRNYCTQAIEDFTRFSYVGQQNHATDTLTEKGITWMTQECRTLLHLAEKFVLPEWGRIFDDEEFSVVSEMEVPNRLPYPVVACEYECDYAAHPNNLAPGEIPSRKRIALAIEIEYLVPYAPHMAGMMFDPNKMEPGFIVAPLAWFEQADLWTPPPAVAVFKRNERPQDLRTTAVMTPLGLDAYQSYPYDERPIRMVRDVSDEALAIVHLIMALGMERANYETIPAPEKLNKKRARSNKPPIFEYKVLDIVADMMATPKQIAGRPQGKHASPRMHKRRGHVRRLSDGRVTWVRNTIVGKPGHGEIDKGYSVHK